MEIISEKTKAQIFFDESGKRDQSVKMMGALMIFDEVYNKEIFRTYEEKIKKKEIGLHWNKYSGFMPTKIAIKELISEFSKYESFCKFNIIRSFKPESKNVKTKEFEDMLYSKIPERIFYGILRDFGSGIHLDIDIHIEHSTEYERDKLDEQVKKQLNNQAIYRGENFRIKNSELCPKGQEIGVELTDIILGFIRTIIDNDKENISKGKKERKLLVLELLKNKDFYNFMSNINYFEWIHKRKLTKIDFHKYIQLFLLDEIK